MTDIDEFEMAEKTDIEKSERLHKLIIHTIGLAVGATVIAILLQFLARYCECTPQNQMAIICQQMINNSKKRGVK